MESNSHSSTNLLKNLPYSNLRERTVLITGANRGLGLGVAKALIQNGSAHFVEVILTGRNIDSLRAHADREGFARKKGVHFLRLDVTSDQSVIDLVSGLRDSRLHVDAILNNAGVAEADESNSGALEQKLALQLEERDVKGAVGETLRQMSVIQSQSSQLLQTFNTNSVGAFRVATALLPGMVKRKFGRIVNVSSGMGGIREMEGGYLPYRVSKAALNAITRVLHAEAYEHGVITNSVCPGWVRTDMGGSQAERSVEEGIYGLLWALTLPNSGPSGGFFRDGEPIEW